MKEHEWSSYWETESHEPVEPLLEDFQAILDAHDATQPFLAGDEPTIYPTVDPTTVVGRQLKIELNQAQLGVAAYFHFGFMPETITLQATDEDFFPRLGDLYFGVTNVDDPDQFTEGSVRIELHNSQPRVECEVNLDSDPLANNAYEAFLKQLRLEELAYKDITIHTWLTFLRTTGLLSLPPQDS